MKVAMLFHPSIHLNVDVCGGLERRVLAEMDYLNTRGHHAKLWVSGMTGGHPDVSVVRDQNWRDRLLQWPYYMRFLRRTSTFDIVHGHYAPALAMLCPERAVVHLAGMKVVEIPLYRHFSGRAHLAEFICNSQHIADKFRRVYPAIPEDHVHVVHNAADISLFAPTPNAHRDTTIHLTYHSLWEEPKGIFDLLAAVEMLEQKRQDFRLHLVGSALFEGAGEAQQREQERVEAWAHRLRTTRLVGPLSHPQLAEHLKHMDVGVFPSNHEEPFGNVVVEMMSAGLPVVAFNIGGPREIVIHGQTGFLVENRNVKALANTLETLIDNEQLRLEMGAKARRRAEEYFTWDRHVDQLLEVYARIIKRNRDRGR